MKKSIYQVFVSDERENVSDTYDQKTFTSYDEAKSYYDALAENFVTEAGDHDELWLMMSEDDGCTWQSIDGITAAEVRAARGARD